MNLFYLPKKAYDFLKENRIFIKNLWNTFWKLFSCKLTSNPFYTHYIFFKLLFTGQKSSIKSFLEQELYLCRLNYHKWIVENEKRALNETYDLKEEPLISIVVPLYNTKKVFFKKMVNSVLNQTYKNWELCLVDDGSLNFSLEYLKKNNKVKYLKRDENGGIAVATNQAISMATGDYIAFLDHDDTLSPNAILEVVKAINLNSNIKLLYSDEDKIKESGKYYSPHFKSNWNRDMFFSQNYINHLVVIEKGIVSKVGGIRDGFNGSQDYDLLLRVLNHIENNQIFHIPKILYHWRATKNSTAYSHLAKIETTDMGIKALKDYFKESANVKKGFLPNTYKIEYPIRNKPLVSIIIPTKDKLDLLKTSIESIFDKTVYKNYEILIIDNQSKKEETINYFREIEKRDRVKVIEYNKPFNYSAINNFASKKAKGEILLFLNNDTKIINKGWITEMLQHSLREDIGIVGAKLYYEDKTIQHAGVILGIGGVAGHSHKYYKFNEHGYFSRLKIIQNYSALTGACIMVRREVFNEVGGFEERLKVAFNDIDFCLKVREKGYRNLWTPYAQLYHFESKTREKDKKSCPRFKEEINFMKSTWKDKLKNDPYYNQNLSYSNENFNLNLN